jgi:hypothetical protein
MPYTTAGRNNMLDCGLRNVTPTISVTHAGLFTKQANKTGTAAASTDLISITSHGYSAGDIVVLSGLTGGNGLTAGWIYFVISAGLTSGAFAVSETSGGSAVDITSDASALTANKLAEISGGSPAYARKAIAFGAAALALIDDSTNGAVFDVPAAAQVDYVGMHTASTSGTLMFCGPVTQEVFGAQGTYTLSDAKLDLRLGTS